MKDIFVVYLVSKFRGYITIGDAAAWPRVTCGLCVENSFSPIFIASSIENILICKKILKDTFVVNFVFQFRGDITIRDTMELPWVKDKNAVISFYLTAHHSDEFHGAPNSNSPSKLEHKVRNKCILQYFFYKIKIISIEPAIYLGET